MLTQRRVTRKGYTQSLRLDLLEDDADSMESGLERLSQTVTKELVGLRNRLTGILVAVTTGSIMLTVNAILLGRK